MVKIKNIHVFALIVLIYGALFFIIPQTEYIPADSGIKIIQVKDFIKQGYRTFKAIYNGEQLDPDKDFFPIKPTLAYKIGRDMYYVFPFYLVLLYTPFYHLGGVHGVVLLSLLAGILTLIVSLKIARQLNISEQRRRWLLVFLGFASIVPLYSFMIAEYTLSILLVTCSIFFILLGYGKGNSIYYFLAGLSAGASVFFRVELGLYCALLLLGVIVFRVCSKPGSQLPALVSSFALCALLFAGFNYHICGNIFGLRGIEFMKDAGASFTIAQRALNLFNALVISKISVGLFIAWPLFLFLFALLGKQNRIEADTKEVKLLLFVVTIFSFAIPLVISNKDGSILGPRFLAPIQPLLALITFKVLDFNGMQARAKQIAGRALVIFSAVVMCASLFILYKFNETSHDVNVKVSGHAKKQVVILYDHLLYSSVLPLIEGRIVIAIEPGQDWEAVLDKIKKLGIKEVTVIDFAENKKTIAYPSPSPAIEVMDRYVYSGQYKTILVENVKINF